MSGFNLFNNEQRSGYEELVSYYPIFYRDVREMDAILHICGRMLDGMASAMEAIVLNRFIDTMDEEATARMEVFLYLTGNRGRPLGERKRLIHALLVGHGKMSASKIKEVVQVFTGLPAEVDFIKEYIAIRVPLAGDYQFSLTDIKSTLGKRMPAHLAFYFSFLVGKIIIEEFFKLRRVVNRTSIYWFDTSRMINGTFLLDGSRLLDAQFPPYEIRVWIKTKICSANQVVPRKVNNKFEILLKEKFRSITWHTYTFYWFGDFNRLINGKYDLDGEISLDCILPPYKLRSFNRFKLPVREAFNTNTMRNTFRIKTTPKADIRSFTREIIDWWQSCEPSYRLASYSRFFVIEKEKVVLTHINNVSKVRIRDKFLLRNTIRFMSCWWGNMEKILNGGYMLDGERTLDRNLNDYRMKAVHRFVVRNREKVSAPIVTTTHNLWCLDGAVPLDGQQTLDAYQIKEVW